MAHQSDREKYAAQYVQDRDIDPRTRSRVVPMKILLLSMPRTGTMSMQAALELLGYGPTIHGFNQWMHTRDVKMWESGLRAKFGLPSAGPDISPNNPFGRKEFDNLLGGYEIASDFPSIAFSEELIALYPEAKVIIVERDVDAWYTSFHDTVVVGIFNKFLYSIVGSDPTLLAFHEMTRCWVIGYFHSDSKAELEKNAKKVYKKHYEMIRRLAPKGRLLDYKLGMGWKPLLEFLGEGEGKVEGVNFPRINDAKDFERRSNVMLKIAATKLVKKSLWWLGTFGTVGLGVWFYYKRSSL